MMNDDVTDLYNRVKVGTKVVVTWDSYADGKITPGQSPYEQAKSKGNDRSAAVQTKKQSSPR